MVILLIIYLILFLFTLCLWLILTESIWLLGICLGALLHLLELKVFLKISLIFLFQVGWKANILRN